MHRARAAVHRSRGPPVPAVPVRVIMCDDGSTDDTKALADATMASFGYATGEVIEGTHGGKSKALNMALERCTAEFVYRLDADCALDQDEFVYSVAQFAADPRVGLVGALQMPKEPYSTWIDRMRAFELFYMFGFLRVALAQVDAVPCIPGSFCAFRREAALAVGGFLTGMYSEDTDFTCAITRRRGTGPPSIPGWCPMRMCRPRSDSCAFSVSAGASAVGWSCPLRSVQSGHRRTGTALLVLDARFLRRAPARTCAPLLVADEPGVLDHCARCASQPG